MTVRREVREIFSRGFIPVPESGCWLWVSWNMSDYGRIWFEGERYMAHRISFAIQFGDVPEGLFVCHKCDTKCCVNPSHLYAGTAKDNARDRDERSGWVSPTGERHHNSRLTNEMVIAIRNSNEMPSQLAKKYGVSVGNISSIQTGAKRKSDGGNIRPKMVSKKLNRNVCVQGHAMDNDNTYIYPNGRKACRKCSCLATARYMLRKRLK